MDRIILHSDCNCFYASVEMLYHPELRNRPFAVGGDPQRRHGIILTKNQPAKDCGIKTGEALWQARRKCPDLAVLPPRFALYRKFSDRARQLYLQYTDMVEPFGLDEAWLDVTGSVSSPREGVRLADELRCRVHQELGITVSVGVSWNKVFAKLGSDYKKPNATTAFLRDNWKSRIWPLPVSNLLFVGRATQQKLLEYGVHTIGDLAAMPPKVLQARFGKSGPLLWSYANGLDTSPVERWGSRSAVKSIGNSTTTPRNLTCNTDVKVVFLVLADSVAHRLREQGFSARTVSISVRDTHLHTFTRQHTCPQYTNITREIAESAYQLFCSNYHWSLPVRSVGITVSDLLPAGQNIQTSLFRDEKKRMRAENLDATLDGLKKRYGNACVQPAVLLEDTQLSGTSSGSICALPPAAEKKN
ncbi:DNA polymerase IV [Caproicibacterium lactatifermentans]|uniref:DNA polymerase IV n=1 Tax=Caproicibacterium lactatifermentans TaxID=2666138 RepID=A0ABX6PU67_9FIRM|nr:DNA polymerase IV [Caproicibacterium lactatifermentans]QKO29785.1 DNA polymerase IV [Caproicibacterium lactatifermentans]